MNEQPRPWMPLYVSDYLADTIHLTTAQHGAYLLLIMHYWKHGSLPICDRKLARIVRLRADKWLRMKPIINAFFYQGWRHKRIDKELEKHDIIRMKRAVSGYKGAISTQRIYPANARQTGSNHNHIKKEAQQGFKGQTEFTPSSELEALLGKYKK